MYESKLKITTDLSEFFGFQNITERLLPKARIAVCLRMHYARQANLSQGIAKRRRGIRRCGSRSEVSFSAVILRSICGHGVSGT